jgi:hypothetical protein
MKRSKTPFIFLVSSSLFTAGVVLQVILDMAYPIPLAILDNYRPSATAGVLGIITFVLFLSGFMSFVVGLVLRGGTDKA